MEQTPEASPWATTVVLSSGDTAYVRPIEPSDRAALAEFHERQSFESIYLRFFSPKPTLTNAELERFTDVDMVDRVALAVEHHDRFVAWASYEKWPGRPDAEVAFMVDDEFHGQGIGTLLLEHLAAVARSNGIERFTAEVLAENRAMLSVFGKAGWPLQRRFDSGVIDLDWDLTPTTYFIDSVERREQRADSRAVAHLLLAQSIAVVGASDRPHSIGAALWEHVSTAVGSSAYPVNPNRDEVAGRPCVDRVTDLPIDVSLAIIAVPPAALDTTIDDCIERRLRGAIIVTDITGSDVDIDAIVTRSRRNGLRLIGPSSMGAASPRFGARANSSLLDVAVSSGGVAISLQSGSLGEALVRRLAQVRLGLSWFVSLGDKRDISANDLLQFWEDDESTKVIGLYTETFGNPAKFARIARRVSRRRPIVAVTAGAAADGRLTGPLHAQTGLIEVPTVAALVDTARVLATQPILRGRRVGVVTNSRSPGVLAASALSAAGLEPVLAPLPLAWDARPDAIHAAVTDRLGEEDVDGVVVIHARAVEADVDAVADSIERAARGATKPVVAVLLGRPDGPVSEDGRVPNFDFPEPAAAVLGRSFRYARWLEEVGNDTRTPARVVDPVAASRILHAATDALDPSDADDSRALSVEATHELLRTYGIEVARARFVPIADASSAASEIGFPVALKAERRRTGRSVEAGIALDLVDEDDVRGAVDKLAAALGEDAANVVVQEMVTPGAEARVTCRRDDQLGVVVSVGLGGLQADAIADRGERLAPVSADIARAMLSETRLTAALVSDEFDPSALVQTIIQSGHLVVDHPEVADLDLNPVLVSDGRAVVTDAVITVRARRRQEQPLRRVD